ncbi:thymidylate synthase [Spirosoma sp. HMF3257]|uniref:thymidylate synthase n=1 Tax=Spirosoma telluris TaxID=2183553 RepID=A0A327NLL0_9BACT|nr:thymidylate synthase [Spirosoma telluris]RAI76037.1 thymidylate synthase [Spirosoma telluris]
MYISAQTIDDLMHSVLSKLLEREPNVFSSRSEGVNSTKGLGPSSEIIGAILNLKDPRQRLSRDETKGTIFSALGELLWYLSGGNNLDFITYYIKRYEDETEDGKTIFGGYGPRLFDLRGINQIDNILRLLKEKSTSRRAVIQLFNAEDLVGKHPEIPCTCTLQFLLRDDRLHMFTTMRSNDAFVGLPHDIFAFTMIQEIIARSLNVGLGEYNHAVGSLHLYNNDRDGAEEYRDVGFHSTKFPMSKMPIGDPWKEISIILTIEDDLRNGREIQPSRLKQLNPYWADLVYILYAFSLSKRGKRSTNSNDIRNYVDQLKTINSKLEDKSYSIYIDKRASVLENKIATARP